MKKILAAFLLLAVFSSPVFAARHHHSHPAVHPTHHAQHHNHHHHHHGRA